MYTVIRFSLLGENKNAVRSLIDSLQNFFQMQNPQTDRGNSNRVSLSVCVDPDWNKHEDAISQFIDTARGAIESAQERGATVTFDVAIEPEDRSGLSFYSVPISVALLRKLASGECGITMTVY